MAKKIPAAKPASDNCKQLMDAIATVKQIQEFIKEHGTLEAAGAAVARVQGLIEMTGGFDALTQALEIVGKEPAPQA
jgi:hypothetical protein